MVGRMTAQYALDIGVRDAVSFGPALIVNGVAANYSGSGGGLNPRTAIGQREDGAILLLVIEGRKTSSMGATMADLIDIMLEYGAVNAVNLDGGSSSLGRRNVFCNVARRRRTRIQLINQSITPDAYGVHHSPSG